jgi:pimeloyl-ACP methyl ester carboxylesterase
MSVATGRLAAPRHDPYGLRVEWTVVAGRPVRSLSAGARTWSPEVVLIPGLGAPGYLVPWARRSARWTRTTLLDLPGWRRGRARGCLPTLAEAALTTARWLARTDRRDVVLVGHSTGAQVALLAARLATGRVVGLGLAGPTFDPAARSWPVAFRRALAIVGREPAGAAEVAVPSYLRSGGLPLLRFVRTALDDRPEDHVGDLQVPLLVLTGRRDPFCPLPWAADLAGAGGTSCHVLEGGHMAQYSDPGSADELLHLAVRTWTR